VKPSSAPTSRDVIVIGASAGGVTALRQLVANLAPALPAAIFVVVHVPPQHVSKLPALLDKHGAFAADHARDGEPIRAGRIYIAPPDHHMVLEDGHIRLNSGARENHNRPAIDPLFRSAAHTYGNRVIAVILSGFLDDGTAGMLAVKRHGGATVVQDPTDAAFPDMVRNAMANVDVDHTATIHEMGPLLARLAAEEVPAMPAQERQPRRPAEEPQEEDFGKPSPFSCPDCGGVLRERNEGGFPRFRCRTGHTFSPETLVNMQGEVIEASLWTALRAMEENMEMLERMEKRAEARGSGLTQRRYRDRHDEVAAAANVIHELLHHPYEVEPMDEEIFEPDSERGDDAPPHRAAS
jgi:two-component system chemotaxis response regulator CheB